MVEAYFYGGGIFLRWRHISTAKAHFCGGGVSLRRKCICMKKVNFKRNRLITCMEKRNHCTAQMSFYVETALF